MIEIIYAFNENIDLHKRILEGWITDKSNSLEQRWATWCEAPSCLKNSESDLVSFENLPEDFICYDGYYNVDRYQTVCTKSMIENIEYSYDNFKKFDFFGGGAYRNLNIDALKEEILTKNLGSFVYDW
jgi:hypothetical protein